MSWPKAATSSCSWFGLADNIAPPETFKSWTFGGISELPKYLRTLATVEGYAELESIIVARDAESSARSAIASIRSAFEQVGLPVPPKPFVWGANGAPRTAFMIFPGPTYQQGALEDLCLEIVKDDPIMPCVEEYVMCLKEQGSHKEPSHLSKRKVHTFLSGKELKFIGATIGQASYRGAWDSEHPALRPFRDTIETM